MRSAYGWTNTTTGPPSPERPRANLDQLHPRQGIIAVAVKLPHRRVDRNIRPSLEAARAENRRRQRFITNARIVHRLGDRATVELLNEIAERSGQRCLVESITRAYAAISPVALKITGGDGFPPFLFEVAPTLSSGNDR